ADGSCIVTKASNTGGLVDTRTVKEQLLYEIHDPAAYLTPDVVADISDAEVAEVGRHRVRLTGVRGHPRTPTLKANVFFDGGWLGEGEISYAGEGAEARARLAMDVMQKRVGRDLLLRFDLIGVISVLGDDTDRLLNATRVGAATDVRLRVAAKHEDAAHIDRMLRELTALWTGGPAGGGGVRVAKRQRLSLKSCLVPRERVSASYAFV
ncbi:MAG TPA: acyclic terpene utilization AtuA family protein, partial [Burkholderiaceae bacterium]|nr:acyclic terpene utilization AtuA family protein [Burkholderiaceae bacterium]